MGKNVGTRRVTPHGGFRLAERRVVAPQSVLHSRVIGDVEDAGHSSEMRETFRDPFRKRHVDGDAGLGDALEILFGVLFAVGEHKVGESRDDRLDVGVFGSAHHRDRLDVGGGLDAVARAPDQKLASAEHHQRIRVARD